MFRSRLPPFDKVDAVVAETKRIVLAVQKQFDPLLAWSNLRSSESEELFLVAQVLLRAVPSEGAAERSFSSQSDVHSSDRNRLSAECIQAEMRIKWNGRKLAQLNLPEEEGDLELTDSE